MSKQTFPAGTKVFGDVNGSATFGFVDIDGDLIYTSASGVREWATPNNLRRAVVIDPAAVPFYAASLTHPLSTAVNALRNEGTVTGDYLASEITRQIAAVIKPTEPTAVAAMVEDSGHKWVRTIETGSAKEPWVRVGTNTHVRRHWHQFSDSVKVVSTPTPF